MNEDNLRPSRESNSEPLPDRVSPTHRILLVEDDFTLRQFSTQALIRFGYHVDAAEDGAVAWDTLQRNSYDLLVTDNDMPKVSGVELLKKLRSARMALPVIMATGAVPKEEFKRNPWLQPAATLLKPFTDGELLATVRKVLHASDPPRQQTDQRDWRSHPSDGGLQM